MRNKNTKMVTMQVKFRNITSLFKAKHTLNMAK